MTRRVRVDDGFCLSVRIEGADDRPPLILSNSLGTDVGMWEPQLEALSRTFRIVRYDIRGHGGSDVPKGDYSLDRLGRDVLAIADELGLDRFDFAGVSLGGMTGLWLGINAPDRVGRAVIANAAPFAAGPAGWAERGATVRADGMGAIADGVVARWFTPTFAARSPETVAALQASLMAIDPVGYAGCCAAIGGMDLRSAIAEISIPVLLIAGAHDTTPPPAAIQAMASGMPNARAIVLEAAHLSNIEAAYAFTSAMLEFLRP